MKDHKIKILHKLNNSKEIRIGIPSGRILYKKQNSL